MTAENALTIVDFHGAKLLAARGDSPETTLVAMKPLVEAMGLNWSGQLAKIKAHPILFPTMEIISTVDAGGKQREMAALPLNRLSFWHATLNANMVPTRIRAKVIAYQTECADVLFAHFFGKAAARGDDQAVADGIIRLMLDKAVAPLRAQIEAIRAEMRAVIAGFDPSQSVVIDYKPMLEVLKDAGVGPLKRRALSQQCSSRMRRWLVDNDRTNAIRCSRETGRYLFHVEAAKDWIEAEGRALIRDHKARVAGQGVLMFNRSKLTPVN